MTAPTAGATPPRPSFLVRALRTLVRALLIAFLIGFSVGTLMRCAAERSATPSLQYLGDRSRDDPGLCTRDEGSGPRESARAA
jgi:hypothetical protein